MLHENLTIINDEPNYPYAGNKDNHLFIKACEEGDLNYIKKQTINKNFFSFVKSILLFIFPKYIKQKFIFDLSDLDISKTYYSAVKRAAAKGNLEVVKFFFEHPYFLNLNNKIIYQTAFDSACEFEKINIVDYLLGREDFLNQINLSEGFIQAINNQSSKTLEHFVFDLNLSKTKEIEDFLKTNPNSEIESMFMAKELTIQLKKNSGTNKGKSKI